MLWSPHPLVPWSSGSLVLWSPGPLVPWSSGLLVRWSLVAALGRLRILQEVGKKQHVELLKGGTNANDNICSFRTATKTVNDSILTL